MTRISIAPVSLSLSPLPPPWLWRGAPSPLSLACSSLTSPDVRHLSLPSRDHRELLNHKQILILIRKQIPISHLLESRLFLLGESGCLACLLRFFLRCFLLSFISSLKMRIDCNQFFGSQPIVIQMHTAFSSLACLSSLSATSLASFSCFFCSRSSLIFSFWASFSCFASQVRKQS